MEFRLLGPVEAWAAGRLIELGSPRQRGVFAALAVDTPRLVPLETIMDRIWGERPPARARDTLYVYIARIRRLLAEAAVDGGQPTQGVSRSGGGYVLDVPPEQVDLHRFSHLVGQARDPACPAPKRAALLREALRLHRGVPLAGIPGDWAERVREVLTRHHLDAVTAWGEAELRLGNGPDVIDRLTGLVADNPLAEPVVAVLMQALYANGRGADALNCYVDLRTRLVEELGTDPGPDLQRLHLSILRGEPLPTPAPEIATLSRGDVGRTVPAQLPLDVRGFVGRASELAHLDTLLGAAQCATAVGIAVLSGTGGVGKTALAVHWGHRVADRFPDGQLYVNLRGFDPAGRPLTVGEAVRVFLDAFAVPPHQIPASLDAQTALFRSFLAGKRILVVLDNARDVEQVRPLLPGTPSCAVVVTSRSSLAGLVVRDGARRIDLDLLPLDEAVGLLRTLIGARADVEPGAAATLAEQCARLPLALRVAAELAATRPGITLGALVGELTDQRQRLHLMHIEDDPHTDVSAVFSWSYRSLGTEAARLFRLLGLHPGPDISVPAAASLAGLPHDQARQLLDHLARAHLLTEHAPDRFEFHDLLRAYAGELADHTDAETDRRTAFQRLVDQHLHSARTAELLLDPQRDPVIVAPPSAGVAPGAFTGRPEALRWFTTEHFVLLAILRSAAEARLGSCVWQLAWVLGTYLDRQGHWSERAATLEIALTAARRGCDGHALADSHRLLGRTYNRLHRYDVGSDHLEHALTQFRTLADLVGQAHTHHHIAAMYEYQERYDDALRHSRQALDLYQAAGHSIGYANALNTVGWYHAMLGEHQQAITHCERAVVLHRDVGDISGEGSTWDSIGYAHHHLGHYQQAVECFTNALEIFRQLKDRFREAQALQRLGDTYESAGDPAARDAWQEALTIFDDLRRPDADEVRARLRGLANR